MNSKTDGEEKCQKKYEIEVENETEGGGGWVQTTGHTQPVCVSTSICRITVTRRREEQVGVTEERKETKGMKAKRDGKYKRHVF